MPDTGVFYLLEIRSDCLVAAHPDSVRVEYVYAKCLFCSHVFRASGEPSLIRLPRGGAVLQCPDCGVRQAIAGRRIAEFMDRFPTGSSSPPPKELGG